MKALISAGANFPRWLIPQPLGKTDTTARDRASSTEGMFAAALEELYNLAADEFSGKDPDRRDTVCSSIAHSRTRAAKKNRWPTMLVILRNQFLTILKSSQNGSNDNVGCRYEGKIPRGLKRR
jgi:hypothetical protein